MVVFTANVKDFARLHREWWSQGRTHAGIVGLSDQSLAIGSQVAGLVRLAMELDAPAMRGRLEFLSTWLPPGR